MGTERGSIWAIAISPDASRVVYAGEQGVRLRELSDGGRTVRVRGHRADVHAVALSPDGHRALTGDDSGLVRAWDTRRVETTATFRSSRAPVRGAAFVPDGRVLIVADAVRLFDADTGELVGASRALNSELESCSVTVSPDGAHAVVVDPTSQAAWLVALPSLAIVRTLEAAMAVLLPSGELFAATPEREWTLTRGADEVSRGELDEEPCGPAVATPDGNVLFTSYEDRVVLWGVEQQRALARTRPAGRKSGLALATTARVAVIAAYDGPLQLWSLDTLEERVLPESPTEESPRARAPTIEGPWTPTALPTPMPDLAIGGARARCLGSFGDATEGHVTKLACSLEHRVLLVSKIVGRSSSLRYFDLASGLCVREVRTDETMYPMALSPDAGAAASGPGDSSESVLLWTLSSASSFADGERLGRMPEAAQAAAFSGDGRVLAVGDCKGYVAIWDLERRTASARNAFARHAGLTSVVLSRDGARLLVGGDDCPTMLYRAIGDAPIEIGPPTRVDPAGAFSPDGSIVASSGALRKVADGSDVTPPGLPAGAPTFVSDDLLAIREERSIALFDIGRRALVDRIRLAEGDAPTVVLASSDGQVLFVGTRRGLVLAFDLREARG